MGGREVGGLANQLAAHMGFSPGEVDRVRRFWNAPRMATREGRKAVQMFEAIERREIKALWVMATNPAVSLPRAGAVREALRSLELFVVSENVRSNDTVNCGAHVLLPAAAWGEKSGTVTNSERCISRQRAFVPAPTEARPDWWIVSEVARRMGFAEAFSYRSEAEVFREHAALTAFENAGTRDLDLGGLAALSDEEYDALAPVQWPVRKGEPCGKHRFFGSGGFFTPDRKARFVAPEPPCLHEGTSAAYPFRLNTGRSRDQWHTMTRSGLSPRLAAHMAEPFVEVHPRDAAAMALRDGGFARVSTAHGSCIVRVQVSDNQQPGSLFLPIHWSAETASSACVGELVSSATDPHSGQPEAKATPAAVAAVEFPLHGFARSRVPLTLPAGTWWSRVAAGTGLEYRLATSQGPMIWHDFAHRSLTAEGRLAERLEGGVYRAAALHDSDVEGYLWVGPAASPPRLDLEGLAEPTEHDTGRLQEKSASRYHMKEIEPIVCACFQVGIGAVRRAVNCGAANSVEDISQHRCAPARIAVPACRS